jgi:TonB family protein
LRSAGFVRQLTDREKPVVEPQSKPFRSGKTLSADDVDRDSSPEISSRQFGYPARVFDESTALSSLKELIAAGDQRLDAILANITDAARQLTGASGAALAMWKDGAMVCRARSGDTAPALGARLSAGTGISGKCLRTGEIQNCADTENDPLVDVEVCRSRGLRSIAILPIHGWRGINGILEVFSTQPAAFTETHIALLQQLAALAERGRASQPHGASSSPASATKSSTASGTTSAALTSSAAIEKAQPSGLLPASDRVADVVLAFLGTRSRPFVLCAIGLVAISLLAAVVWLGWRGPDETDGKAHAATPDSAYAATANSLTAHPPDNDPVWRPNPGGEFLLPSGAKPSAGAPVKFASKVDVVRGNKTQASRSQADRSEPNRSPLLADLASKVAADPAIPPAGANSQVGLHTDQRSADSPSTEPLSTDRPSDETRLSEASSVPANSTNQSAASTVLTAKASSPGFSAPGFSAVSQGVSGGQLLHRVSPVYPAQARLLRLEGKVILAAMVMEDGTVGDVKVVEGAPALAQSAVDAVKHWRYQPFELDGKPVKNEIRINVDFKNQ